MEAVLTITVLIIAYVLRTQIKFYLNTPVEEGVDNWYRDK